MSQAVLKGFRVDFVATADTGIGPSNRWYPSAVAAANVHTIDGGLEVRAITPIFFVATKLEAFRGRGRGDYNDLEDVLTVLSGLPDLRDIIARDDTEVATAVRSELATLAATEAFIDLDWFPEFMGSSLRTIKPITQSSFAQT